MGMKKLRAALLGIAAASILASGCSASDRGAGFDPDQNSIYVKKDGTVENAAVVYTDKDYYEKEGLKQEIEESIQASGQEISLVSCSVEKVGDQYQLKYILGYNSPEELLEFNQQIRNPDIQLSGFSTDSVADCLASGGLVDGSFVDLEGDPVETSDITSQSSWRVVQVQGEALIQTQGKIQYVSQGCRLQDSYRVVTPQEGVSYIVFN